MSFSVHLHSWDISQQFPFKSVTQRQRIFKSPAFQLRASQRPQALNLEAFEAEILNRQQLIIKEAEGLDGGNKRFKIDKWQRDETSSGAGYGITAVLEDGALLEKAAVNISIINGTLSPERAKAMSSRGRLIDQAGGQKYSAAALSLVFHPLHPFVPTLRADVRCFKVGEESWFGGGCDLTPTYFFEEDAKAFHKHWQAICNSHKSANYSQYKDWCDKYFYIPARKEHRGIGGIFFDDLSPQDDGDVEAFVSSVAREILPSWTEIAKKRGAMDYTKENRDWQLVRRGRYLEFNLLYDRGVKFGLNGRIESVMVSAPPLIAWKYDVRPEPGSPEEALLDVLRTPKKWVE